MRILPNAHRVLLRETTGQVGLIEHITDHVLRRNKSVLRGGRDHDVEGLVHLRHQRLLLTYAPQKRTAVPPTESVVCVSASIVIR